MPIFNVLSGISCLCPSLFAVAVVHSVVRLMRSPDLEVGSRGRHMAFYALPLRSLSRVDLGYVRLFIGGRSNI
jgi:hypothetical protein